MERYAPIIEWLGLNWPLIPTGLFCLFVVIGLVASTQKPSELPMLVKLAFLEVLDNDRTKS